MRIYLRRKLIYVTLRLDNNIDKDVYPFLETISILINHTLGFATLYQNVLIVVWFWRFNEKTAKSYGMQYLLLDAMQIKN